MTATLYLVRHATPDWSRADIPYFVPPGPPLTPQGEREASELGAFLRGIRPVRLVASPLERAWRTAEIAGAACGVEWVMDEALREWHPDDTPESVRARLVPAFERDTALSRTRGAVVWVTHGGPVGLLLEILGLSPSILSSYRQRFDHGNPLPPAGMWKVARTTDTEPWSFECAFMPATRTERSAASD